MRVENNNLIKASLRDSESPPPGSIPRDEQRHLQRTPSHTSHEGEGHFIPEDDGVRVQSTCVVYTCGWRYVKISLMS